MTPALALALVASIGGCGSGAEPDSSVDRPPTSAGAREPTEGQGEGTRSADVVERVLGRGASARDAEAGQDDKVSGAVKRIIEQAREEGAVVEHGDAGAPAAAGRILRELRERQP